MFVFQGGQLLQRKSYFCNHPQLLLKVFSLLKNLFGLQQDNSLQDYVEASLMLQFNKRKCFCQVLKLCKYVILWK